MDVAITGRAFNFRKCDTNTTSGWIELNAIMAKNGYELTKYVEQNIILML